MKNRTLFLSVAVSAFMLLALSSCKNKPADGQQPTADSIQPAPTTEKPTNGQTSDAAFTCKQITREKTDKVYHVKLSIDFPVSGNDPLVNAVREYISESLGSGYYSEDNSKQGSYSGELSDGEKMADYYFNLKVNEYEADIPELGEDYPVDERGPIEADTKISKVYESDKVISYNYFSNGYMGGAHGSTISTGVTFRKTDGRRVTWDMFSNNSQLQEIIKKGLKKYFNVKTDEELLNCLLDISDVAFIPMPVSAPVFQKDGILFVYQQYEIAAYAAGQPSFVLPYNEAKEVMNTTGKNLLP